MERPRVALSRSSRFFDVHVPLLENESKKTMMPTRQLSQCRQTLAYLIAISWKSTLTDLESHPKPLS